MASRASSFRSSCIAINLIASIIGVITVSSKEDEDPMHALNRGFYVTSALAFLGFAIAVHFMLQDRYWLLACGAIGLITAFLFVWITEYYTESRYAPVQSIARASLTGPATNIISGLAVGMETPALPVVVISAALLLSYYFGVRGLADVGDISVYSKGIYGTAIATMGMLSCAAYILAMDTFGPITDNAGGIIEMSNQEEHIRNRTDKLDSAGNTTKALTKGYAIGSASLAAFLLFSAYLAEIKDIVIHKVAAAGINGYMPPHWGFTNINLASVPVFVGGLLGATLTYLFSSMAIKAVGRTAQRVVEDVRRQFRENPGIMLGTSKPDYGRCVFDRDRGCARRDGPARPACRWPAHRRRPDLPQLQRKLSGHLRLDSHAGGPHHQRQGRQPGRRRGRGRAADGRHHLRRPACHVDEQRRWRMGQR